jgi:hypothetical protein
LAYLKDPIKWFEINSPGDRGDMFDNKYRRNLATLLIPLLLSACASNPTIKIGLTETENSHSRGVLWPFSEYKTRYFERLNHAYVLSVDGKRIPAGVFTLRPLIELSEGTHEVTIQDTRDSSICSYAGCWDFEQTVASVVLHVEAGHSYFPLARKFCGKDWVWVIDKGENAENDLRKWRKPGLPRDYKMILKDLTGFKIVAGEAPPNKCNSK